MVKKEKKKGPTYRERVHRQVEEGLAPRSMKLGPHVEIEGSRCVRFERHSGLLEYSGERVLVLAAAMLYEVQGQRLVISAMSRDALSVEGRIEGVRLLEDEA